MTRAAAPLGDVPVRRVTAGPAQLAVADTGNDGAAVVFVPGYTGSKEDFAPLFEPLGRSAFRALSFDQRGQFESPSRGDAGHDPYALAEDLVALVTALELGPVHLVGHSFGGLVARAATIAAPHAFTSLVLMCSGPAALPRGPRLSMLGALRPVLIDGGLPAVWAAYQTGDDSEFARHRFLAQDPRAVLEMGDALLTEPDRTSELRAVCGEADIPVLVLCGEHDDAWPPAVQRQMAEQLAASFVAVPGASHSPAVEQPAHTARALVTFWRNAAPVTRSVTPAESGADRLQPR